MREQVNPPLAAALLVILESHKYDWKGSLDGSSPIPCSGRDSDVRDVLEHKPQTPGST